MRYISTRGEAPALGFEDVLLTGLATDGGLYVPESLPHFSLEEIRSWRGLPYSELAFKVMHPFVDDAIPADDFRKMTQRKGVASYTLVEQGWLCSRRRVGHVDLHPDC